MRKTLWMCLVGLAGCGAGPMAAVRQQAITDMNCEGSKLAITQPTAGVNLFYVDGCGETRRYVAACNVNGYCPTVQGQPASAMIKKQAAFDLRCDEAKVAIQFLGADTFGARGCDHQASYVLLCDVGPCKVIQNTQTQRP